MSEYNVDISKLRKEDFTVEELKQRLTRLSVDLPADKRSKQFYFDLYVDKLRELQTEATPEPKQTATVSRSTAKKRKRKGIADEEEENNGKESTSMTDEDNVASEVPVQQEGNTKKKQRSIPSVFEDEETAAERKESQPPVLQPSKLLPAPTISASDATPIALDAGIRNRKSYLNPNLQQRLFRPSATQPAAVYSASPIPDISSPSNFSPGLNLTNLSDVKQGRLSIVPPSPSNESVISNVDISQLVTGADESFNLRKCFVGTLVVLMWTVLIVASYLVIFGGYNNASLPHGLPYCDSELPGSIIQFKHIDPKNCQECPKMGYCAEGRLIKCREGYIAENAICVEDQTIAKNAMNMVHIMQQELSDLAGKFECGYSTKKWMTEQQVRQMLREKLSTPRSGDTNTATDPFELSFEKAQHMINSSTENLQLVIKMENVTNLLKNGNTTSSVKETKLEKVFYSTHPNLNLGCRVKKTMQQYKLHLAVMLMFTLLFLISNIFVQRKVKYARDLDAVVKVVIAALMKHKTIVAVHLRDELKQKAENSGIEITNQLWDDVRTIILKDSRFTESQDDPRAVTWNFMGDGEYISQL
jgi:hypothetical protein